MILLRVASVIFYAAAAVVGLNTWKEGLDVFAAGTLSLFLGLYAIGRGFEAMTVPLAKPRASREG